MDARDAEEVELAADKWMSAEWSAKWSAAIQVIREIAERTPDHLELPDWLELSDHFELPELEGPSIAQPRWPRVLPRYSSELDRYRWHWPWGEE